MAECKMFLQHPRHCDRTVPYRNPHCLSPEDNKTIYTDDLSDYLCLEAEVEITDFGNPIDFFAHAPEQEALAYTESPHALRTDLYKHQKQALTFMVQRESGWVMNGHHKDVWKEERDLLGQSTYLNTITGQKQSRAPPQFRGGLLIDAPGLGKSLSIIALLLYNDNGPKQDNNGEASLSTTLLIVPKTCKPRFLGRRNLIDTKFISDPNLERRVAKVNLSQLNISFFILC